MAIVSGGLAALVALFGCLYAKVDPFLCLERATLAFLLGWVCGQVWHLLNGAVLTGSLNSSATENSSGVVENESIIGDTN